MTEYRSLMLKFTIEGSLFVAPTPAFVSCMIAIQVFCPDIDIARERYIVEMSYHASRRDMVSQRRCLTLSCIIRVESS